MSMSSGLWKKSGNPGIFGGSHKKNPFSPGHDPMMDGAQEWDKLEKEYYEDFDRRAANPVDHQYKNIEDQSSVKNQTESISHPDTSRDIEEAKNQGTPVDSTGGTPYREEAMKVTDIRRGGHKRLRDLISNRFSNRFSRGKKAPPETKPVDCPERGCKVCFSTCAGCSNFQVWNEQDEGPLCYHEHKDLESRGYYDGTWDDHPENFDSETFQRIHEEKRNSERVNREMERERPKLERLAKELQKDGQSSYEFLKNRFGDPDGKYEIDDYDEDDFGGDYDHDCNYDYDDEEEYY